MQAPEVKNIVAGKLDALRKKAAGEPVIDNPLGAPIVHVAGKKLPLYTHDWSKHVLTGAAHVWGLGTEATRSVRDHALKIATAANKKPEITIIDTEGLSVVMEVPVVQLPDPSGTLFDRVGEATDGLVHTGKYHLKTKLPPGEKVYPNDPRDPSLIIPTASSDGIKIGPRPLVARTRSEIIQKINPAWPAAIIELRASSNETGIKMLKERGQKIDLAQEVASILMPDLNLFIDMRYLDREGNISHANLDFSFSENSLRFGSDGRPLPPATVVGGQFFHPALMSLKDFSNVLSARFSEETGGIATINPDTIFRTFMLAPNADEDTRGIIEPYMYRMLAIGRINQLLTQHPAEFTTAISRTINFASKTGEPFSSEEQVNIATELIGGVLGLKDAPIQIKGLTYVDFVTLMHKILDSHDACLQWAGNSKLVSLAVDTARNMPELKQLVVKMGVNIQDSDSIIKNTMSSPSFFALSITPELLFLKAIALLTEEHAHAEVAKAEARRTLARVQTIIDTVARATDIEENVQKTTRDEFKRQTNGMSDGTIEGKEIGKSMARFLVNHRTSSELQE